MGVTRLKRKARRNKQTAAKRQNSMQQLNRKPVIKNIDKEAIKASFGTAAAKEEAPAPVVEETVVEEVVAEAPAAEVEEAPAADAEVTEEPAAEATEETAEEASTDEEENKEEA